MVVVVVDLGWTRMERNDDDDDVRESERERERDCVQKMTTKQQSTVAFQIRTSHGHSHLYCVCAFVCLCWSHDGRGFLDRFIVAVTKFANLLTSLAFRIAG